MSPRRSIVQRTSFSGRYEHQVPVRTELARWRPSSGWSWSSLRIAARTRYVTAVRARSELEPVVRERPPRPNASLSCSTSASSSSSARSARAPSLSSRASSISCCSSTIRAWYALRAVLVDRRTGRRRRRRRRPSARARAPRRQVWRAGSPGRATPFMSRTRTVRPPKPMRQESPSETSSGSASTRAAGRAPRSPPRRCGTRRRLPLAVERRPRPLERVAEVDTDRLRRRAGDQLGHRLREQLGQHGDRRSIAARRPSSTAACSCSPRCWARRRRRAQA